MILPVVLRGPAPAEKAAPAAPSSVPKAPVRPAAQ